jgi:hypothetical protein
MKFKRGKEAKIKKKLDRFRDKLATEEDYYKEAYRYYENAKERLKTSPIEYNRYQDAKPVREACGTAYLATLLALDGYFISRGVPNAELPDATDIYIAFLKEFLVHNGKVTQAFHTVWENLLFGWILSWWNKCRYGKGRV